MNITKGDKLTFNDRVKIFVAQLQNKVTVHDNYTLKDKFLLREQNAQFAGPDSFNISDSVVILLLSELETVNGDNILLSDSINTFLSQNPTFSDNITLTDSVSIVLFLEVAVADKYAIPAGAGIVYDFNDISIHGVPINVQFLDGTNPTVNDTLSFSDGVQIFIGVGLDAYIRRYLNDVIN